MRNHSESDGKRCEDGSKNVARNWRWVKESERDETVSGGTGDGSFVTVRSVCFSSVTARTRSANQPHPSTPPPHSLASSRPPFTIYPPTSDNTCPHSDLSRWGCSPCYTSLCTHNYVCLRGHTRWLHPVHVPVKQATYSLESNLKPRVNDQLLRSADKLTRNISTRASFLCQRLE